MLKQMTSLLLVLAMVLTMLPISAFAEESAPAETQAQETVAETAAPEKSDFPPENTVVAEPVLPES